MNILHLSDIHFGRNYPEYGLNDPFDHHDKIIDGIIDVIASMDDALKPEHIIFTGDIVWHGKRKDKWDSAAGVSQLCSEEIGKGNKEEANRIFSMNFFLTVVISVLIALTGIVFSGQDSYESHPERYLEIHLENKDALKEQWDKIECFCRNNQLDSKQLLLVTWENIVSYVN